MKKQNYRNPYQYNYVCSTTPSATLNHRIRNVHQIQSSTLDTGKATALWKKFQKMKVEFDLDTLRNNANVKKKLTKKFVALAPYWRKSLCY